MMGAGPGNKATTGPCWGRGLGTLIHDGRGGLGTRLVNSPLKVYSGAVFMFSTLVEHSAIQTAYVSLVSSVAGKSGIHCTHALL